MHPESLWSPRRTPRILLKPPEGYWNPLETHAKSFKVLLDLKLSWKPLNQLKPFPSETPWRLYLNVFKRCWKPPGTGSSPESLWNLLNLPKSKSSREFRRTPRIASKVRLNPSQPPEVSWKTLNQPPTETLCNPYETPNWKIFKPLWDISESPLKSF